LLFTTDEALNDEIFVERGRSERVIARGSERRRMPSLERIRVGHCVYVA
jgi:hypothetical protein